MKKYLGSFLFISALLALTSCGKVVPNYDSELVPENVTTVSATVTTSAAETKTTTSISTTSTSSATTLTTTPVPTTTVAATAAPTTAAATAAPTTAPRTTAAPPPATTVTEAPTEPPTQGYTEPSASGFVGDWQLALANKNHTIGSYQPPELVTLYNGTQVDSRMYPDLQAMYDAMKAIGLCPYTREGYRTYTDQQEIMDNRIATHLAEGYSYEGALEQAEKYVAIPGTSEHQLGLAVDINAYDGNDYGVYSWLADHAYEYGFILRYPQGKEYTTGYEYEPWHYRYVGKTAASYIYWNDITLEDYLGMY